MNNILLRLSIAQPEDAQIWITLACQTDGIPQPENMSDAIAQFLTASPAITQNRYLTWRGEEPIGLCQFRLLENVVELQTFFLAEPCKATYAPAALRQIIDLARERGTVLTVAIITEDERELFLDASFKVNARAKLLRSLADYEIQEIRLPVGITLRHPTHDDETAVGELSYKNYRGAVDEEMVCSSRAQAIAAMQAIFHSEYGVFAPVYSFLAFDEQHQLIGNILLTISEQTGGEELAWVADISVRAEWRGKGLGKALLVSSLNAVKAAGYTHIGLTVTLGNENALALYHSLGFQDVGMRIYEAVLHL